MTTNLREKHFGPTEAVVPKSFLKKVFLKISLYSQENTFMPESFFDKIVVPQAGSFTIKGPQQSVFYEYCEIFKNFYFEKHLRTAASGFSSLSGRNTFQVSMHFLKNCSLT